MFKNKALDIGINCKMKIVNYLHLALNLKRLNDGFYNPYKKPYEETNYIHVNFKTAFKNIHFKTTSNVNRKTVIIFIII